MLELLNKAKDLIIKYKKYILYVAIGLVLLLGIKFVYTNFIVPEIKEYRTYKKDIKALQKENKQLIKHQQEIDAAIANYQNQISALDIQIGSIKEKTIIIKEYYREKGEEVNNYTTTQVDSFFKARYNY